MKKLIPNYNPYNDIDWKSSSKENFNLTVNITDWYGNGNTVMPVEKINKIAAYDKVSGEWEPANWREDEDSYDHAYPGGRHFSIEDWKNIADNYPENFNHIRMTVPAPDESTAKLPNGDLFSGNVFHLTKKDVDEDQYFGSYPSTMASYKVYGVTKTLEEAHDKALDYAKFLHEDINYLGNRNFSVSKHNENCFSTQSKSGRTYFLSDPIKDVGENTIGYRWSQQHDLSRLNESNTEVNEKGRPDLALKNQKENIQYYHRELHDKAQEDVKNKKTAAYDKITGEWSPAGWSNSQEHTSDYQYPPLIQMNKDERMKIYQNGWKFDSTKPRMAESTAKLPNGDLFSADIMHVSNGKTTGFTFPECRVYGLTKTLEDAKNQASKYRSFHHSMSMYGEDPNDFKIKQEERYGHYSVDIPDEWGGPEIAGTKDGYTHISNLKHKSDNNFVSGTYFEAKPIKDSEEKEIGWSWKQTHFFPEYRFDIYHKMGKPDAALADAKDTVENFHHDLHDHIQSNMKTAKVYVTAKREDGSYYTKVSDRLSPEELGPEFSGESQADQIVGQGVDNQPEGVSETIPGNSFFTQNALSSKIAGYDKVTGEWHPEKWTNGAGLDFYPPVTNIKWTDEDQLDWEKKESTSCAPHPELGTISIGRGHLFNGNVDHSENYAEGVYTIYGRAKTHKEALDEAARYDRIHRKTFGSGSSTHYWAYPISNHENKTIGYEWAQDHLFPANENSHGNDAANYVGSLIEKAHKTMVDYNRQKQSSHRLAEIEDMNYEGIGPAFGEGMGPQDAAQNITDVEEGPKAPKGTQDHTTQLPGSSQGQAVLPDVTSWYSASKKNTEDNEYGFYDAKDDESDEDDEDDYDDNYTW